MSKEKIYIDPKELAKQDELEAKFQRERKLKINDLKKILSTPEGRRAIWNELCRAKVFASSFSLNSVQMAYNEGERSVGIALLADVMEANAPAFYQMFTEANSKEKAAKKEEQENDSRN
jgi:hypothetical protein